MTQNILPKECSYGCNTRIYWNTSTSEYWEVFSKKKHVCPNRVNKSSQVTANTSNNVAVGTTTSNTKPAYYSKKPWNIQPKPKMSNSFELLIGQIETVQKKYEVLSDLVTEHNGKVHGSQSHILTNNNILQLIVYYEVPAEGQRDIIKQKFNSFVKNRMVYNNH